MSIKKTVGQRIRKLREERGWSQEELGRKVNLTKQQIYRIETGETGTPLKKIEEFASIFGVPYEFFFEESNIEEMEQNVAHMIDPLVKKANERIPRMSPALRRNLEALFALQDEMDKPDNNNGDT